VSRAAASAGWRRDLEGVVNVERNLSDAGGRMGELTLSRSGRPGTGPDQEGASPPRLAYLALTSGQSHPRDSSPLCSGLTHHPGPPATRYRRWRAGLVLLACAYESEHILQFGPRVDALRDDLLIKARSLKASTVSGSLSLLGCFPSWRCRTENQPDFARISIPSDRRRPMRRMSLIRWQSVRRCSNTGSDRGFSGGQSSRFRAPCSIQHIQPSQQTSD